MFCQGCGKEIKDDVKFCPYCGRTTDITGSAPTNTGAQPAAAPAGAPAASKTMDMKKLIIIGVAAIAVLFILVKILGGLGGSKGGSSASKSDPMDAFNGSWEKSIDSIDDHSWGLYGPRYVDIYANKGISEANSSHEEYFAVSKKDITTQSDGENDYLIYDNDYRNGVGGVEGSGQVRLSLNEKGELCYYIFIDGGWHSVARYKKN